LEDLYCELREIRRRRLLKGASLSIGTPLGDLEGGFVYRRLGERERVQERSVNGNSLSMGTWKEGSFTANTESYVTHIKEALAIEPPSPCIGCVRGSWNEGS